MKPRRHLDLFSGIGGFALAAKWAGFQTVAFCENDKFARRILAKNFPGVPIHEDARKLDGGQFEGLELITGGFPCQPWSQVGQRKGRKDSRELGQDLVRIVSEARPRWVLVENVSRFIALGLDALLADLENINYAAEPVVLPACAVDAPHRRDRVWIMAHANEKSQPGQPINEQVAERLGQPGGESWWANKPRFSRVANGLPHRLDRAAAIGNAVVPQLVFEILRLMK